MRNPIHNTSRVIERILELSKDNTFRPYLHVRLLRRMINEMIDRGCVRCWYPSKESDELIGILGYTVSPVSWWSKDSAVYELVLICLDPIKYPGLQRKATEALIHIANEHNAKVIFGGDLIASEPRKKQMIENCYVKYGFKKGNVLFKILDEDNE